MHYMTYFVKAYFKPLYKDVTVKVATGETKKGFFGGEKEVMRKEIHKEQIGCSDREVDGVRLMQDIVDACNELAAEGYHVVNMVDVTSGAYDFKFDYKGLSVSSSTRILSETEKVSSNSGGYGYGYGYGYSYTEGVIILAAKA